MGAGAARVLVAAAGGSRPDVALSKVFLCYPSGGAWREPRRIFWKSGMLKRGFDIVAAATGMLVLALPMIVVALAVKFTSRGRVLYWSERVGRYNRNFWMPKFRTMQTGTPALPTHLMNNPESYLTPIGSFLRRTSLDELPQLWSILVGHMSVVGPRPALFNQDDLVALRNTYGIDRLSPGLTGWAQVKGRDSLPIPDKVGLEAEYLARQSFLFDLKIVAITFLKVVKGDGIAH